MLINVIRLLIVSHLEKDVREKEREREREREREGGPQGSNSDGYEMFIS